MSRPRGTALLSFLLFQALYGRNGEAPLAVIAAEPFAKPQYAFTAV